MNIIERAWQWLFTKHQKESTVTDTAAINTDSTTTTATDTATAVGTNTPNETTSAVTTTTVTTDDSVLAKVKELLISIGHDVEDEFDEVVALAKKIVTKSVS